MNLDPREMEFIPSEQPSRTQASGRHAESLADVTALPTGLVLAGKYRIETVLGRGGMGAVYAATELAAGKRVAIKIRLPRSPEHRFSTEATAAARIRHPNVIDIYDIGNEDGASYLVMELLEGETLAAALKRGRLAVPRALAIVRAAAEGVSAAHAKGVIHRDLKPDNIFLTAEQTPRIKVLDFGIAKLQQDDAAAHDAITQSGSLLGTPSYMSPEQLHTPERVDARSDVYSLGVILYEALTGQKPFPSANYNVLILQISTARALPPQQLNRDIPASVAALIERAMAPDPHARFQDVEELIGALRREEGKEPSSAGPREVAVSPARGRRRAKLLTALVLVAIALAGASRYAARTWSPTRHETPEHAAASLPRPAAEPSRAAPAAGPTDEAVVRRVEAAVVEPTRSLRAVPARPARPARAKAASARTSRNAEVAPARATQSPDDWAGPLVESDLH